MFGGTDHSVPFGLKHEVVVGFIKVNDAQSMYLSITWVFFDHNVDNPFPAGKGISMTKRIVDKAYVGLEEVESLSFQQFAFWG